MISQIPVSETNLVAFRLSGRFEHADYQALLQRIDELRQGEARLSVLLELVDFVGWDLASTWQDLRLDRYPTEAFERIAIVGHGTLQRWMTLISAPFLQASTRFFEHDRLAEAWDWLREPQRQALLDRAEPAPYRRVLVAVDFSAHSIRAVRRALEIATRYDAQVTLVHAVDAPGYYDEGYDPVLAPALDLERQLVEIAEERMRRLIADLGVDNVNTRVVTGSAKAAILSLAEALPADLIVLGRHGHRGVARWLGSTHNGISQGARCDVMVVYLDA